MTCVQNNKSALFWACESGHPTLVKMLMAKGAATVVTDDKARQGSCSTDTIEDDITTRSGHLIQPFTCRYIGARLIGPAAMDLLMWLRSCLRREPMLHVRVQNLTITKYDSVTKGTRIGSIIWLTLASRLQLSWHVKMVMYPFSTCS
jgi:hypothetical protein